MYKPLFHGASIFMMVRARMCLIAIVWGNVDRMRTFLPVFWLEEFNQMLQL
jgi:hypothetical protein